MQIYDYTFEIRWISKISRGSLLAFSIYLFLLSNLSVLDLLMQFPLFTYHIKHFIRFPLHPSHYFHFYPHPHWQLLEYRLSSSNSAIAHHTYYRPFCCFFLRIPVISSLICESLLFLFNAGVISRFLPKYCNN
jgi:hypothetical protein